MIIVDRKKALSFDDVLIKPQYSEINSRKDVDISQMFLGMKLEVPIISSNMDSVTGSNMARAMAELGAGACLHRFCSYDENANLYSASPNSTMVSVGLGEAEFDRAVVLRSVGASRFVIDVAHGANPNVIKQAIKIRKAFGKDVFIVAGNFATADSLKEFLNNGGEVVDAVKVGIGGGSACTTRVVTGCGLPTFASIVECSGIGIPIIADGGIRNSGDIAKAIGAGASAVMIGRLLAATDESLAEVDGYTGTKIYRGSASLESYGAQGKLSVWRAPEGEAYEVSCSGRAKDLINNLAGGLRSSLSYVGASNIAEFRSKVEFSVITGAGIFESGAHGKD